MKKAYTKGEEIVLASDIKPRISTCESRDLGPMAYNFLRQVYNDRRRAFVIDMWYSTITTNN